MKKKIGLGLITLNIAVASTFGLLYSSVQNSFNQKSLYNLDVNPLKNTSQNIQKLITTSPINISESLKAKLDKNKVNRVSSNNIVKKINQEIKAVKVKPINKKIPSYELSLPDSKQNDKMTDVDKLVVKKLSIKIKDSVELNTKEPVTLKAIVINKTQKSQINWVAKYVPFDYQEAAPTHAPTQKIQTIAQTRIKASVEGKLNKIKPESDQVNRQASKASKVNKNNLDRISTAQAATEKSDNNTRVTKNNVIMQKVNESDGSNQINDEILFFDYSAVESPVKEQEKIAKTEVGDNNKVVSFTPKKAIKDSNGQNTITKALSTSNPKKDKNPYKATLLASMESNNSDYSNKKIQKYAVSTHKNESNNKKLLNMNSQKGVSQEILNKLVTSSLHEKPVKKQYIKSPGYESEYSITVSGISLKGITNKLTNFEVRFADDRDDIAQDYGTGSIKMRQKLNSTQAVRRGVILSAGHMPTVVDFVFEDNIVRMNIPLIGRDKLSSIITQSNITGLGGHILVELDDLTEDVEVDVKNGYEKKVYLSKNFKIVNPADSEYAYMLFAGVRPGNVLLNFRTYKNEFTSKIINVANDQIFFDSNFYIELNGEKLDLFEENLLAKDQLPLNIATGDMNLFSFDSKISKKALNRYEINRAVYPLGTRKYQELKHLGESIFIGYWDKAVVDVPSESYMRFILDNFQISNVSSQCLVQLNLSKSAKNLSYEGDSGNGPIRISQLLLDKDGIFYDEFGQNTHKIFLLGEEQGVINLKVEYADESVDYVQTFCSDSTYLIEQL